MAREKGAASVFLMAIKPSFIERILDNTKHHELRRSSAKFSEGDLVIVYASAPVKAILAAFTVSTVRRGPPKQLWDAHGVAFGVSLAEYEAYFRGAALVSAIEIRDRVRVSPVSLAKLRAEYPGFSPPQSYARWQSDPTRLLGGAALDALGWGS